MIRNVIGEEEIEYAIRCTINSAGNKKESVYVFKRERGREKGTDRQTDRQKGKQTNNLIHRQLLITSTVRPIPI